MDNKECLLIIGRFLSETHPIEARLISRYTYNDELIFSRYSVYKRRLIYELILEIYNHRYTACLDVPDIHYQKIYPTFSAIRINTF